MEFKRDDMVVTENNISYGSMSTMMSKLDEIASGAKAYTNPFTIKKVIFNNPATIVFWADGTKTVVKCSEDDFYDAEKGLAMAISKKALGNQGNYYETFKKHLPEEEEVDDEAVSLFWEQLYNMFLGK